MRENGGQKGLFGAAWAIVLGLAAIVLTMVWFQWAATEILTVFLMLPYWGIVAAAVLSMVILSVVSFVKSGKGVSLIRRLAPTLITVTVVLALIFVPFTELYLDHDFASKREAREEVVRKIAAGEIDTEGKTAGKITLPEEYAKLSGYGEVRIDLTDGVKVFFYTFSGVLDSFSGYAYISCDDEKAITCFIDYTDLQELEPMAPCWFWAASG